MFHDPRPRPLYLPINDAGPYLRLEGSQEDGNGDNERHESDHGPAAPPLNNRPADADGANATAVGKEAVALLLLLMLFMLLLALSCLGLAALMGGKKKEGARQEEQKERNHTRAAETTMTPSSAPASAADVKTAPPDEGEKEDTRFSAKQLADRMRYFTYPAVLWKLVRHGYIDQCSAARSGRRGWWETDRRRDGGREP